MRNDQLVEAWTLGWARSRGTAPPLPRPYGFELQVGLPEHLARHVVPNSKSADIRELALRIEQPWVFIKASGPPDLVSAVLPDGWTVTDTGTPMSISINQAQDLPRCPAGFLEAPVQHTGEVISVAIHMGDKLAASGRFAMAGKSAVFDQIVTDSAYQRRGLGRFVMQGLMHKAASLGATCGVLVATRDGRALYNTLGWQVESDWTTAVRLA